MSSTKDEATAYGNAHNFGVAPLDDPELSTRTGLRVYPQLFRIEKATLQPIVTMERALSCEVIVVDQANKPIEGATVRFWPNQHWFNHGGNLLGMDDDSLASLSSEETQPYDPERVQRIHHLKTTDARGIAVITNLPAGSNEDPATLRDYGFLVSHDKYEISADTLPNANSTAECLHVTIPIEDIGKITVRLKKK